MYTHDIPYPPDENSMQARLAEVPNAAGRYQLENYWLDGWNDRHIRELIDEAAAWGRANNVPLTCNESGVFRGHSDPGSRARWIHDVRTALEADGIGWAMWDYRGNFGVVQKQEGLLRRHIRPAALATGISKKIGWHTFRRTTATLLLSIGTSIRVTLELLRHASPVMTLGTYSQAVTEDKIEAQAALASRLGIVAIGAQTASQTAAV